VVSFGDCGALARCARREAGEAIPTFRGIKFTHNDFMAYRQCLGFDDGRVDVLFGPDEMLLAGLDCGARGAVAAHTTTLPRSTWG